MRKSLKLAGFVFGLAIAGAAHAETLPRPTASYASMVTVDSGKTHLTATVNGTGPMERLGAVVNGNEQTVIVNRVTGKIVMLVPALNTSMVMDPGGAGGFDVAALNTIPVTAEGEETIEGEPTTRYAVKAEDQNGSFTGHVWATPDGILMRIEGNTVHNGKTTPVEIMTTSLQRGPQSPALFTPPPSARPMPFGILGLGKGAKTVVTAP